MFLFPCRKCSYALIITKNKEVSNNKIKIEKINHVFKLLDENLDAYEFDFPKEKLLKNKRFNSLTREQQNKLLSAYTNKKNVVIASLFKCNNCGNVEPITSTILLFEVDKRTEETRELTDYEIEFYLEDPTIARTKDYNCKNKDCETHKNKDLKEAVFFKNKDILTYACVKCKHNWTLR